MKTCIIYTHAKAIQDISINSGIRRFVQVQYKASITFELIVSGLAMLQNLPNACKELEQHGFVFHHSVMSDVSVCTRHGDASCSNHCSFLIKKHISHLVMLTSTKSFIPQPSLRQRGAMVEKSQSMKPKHIHNQQTLV